MENTCLYHAGVKGMRWGVRRYQNKDGSLTPAGRKRYAKPETSKGKTAKAKVKAKSETKELTTEEKKSKVLASRSAKELYENRKMFNYDEMNRAHKLLEVDKKVKDMIVEEPNKVEKFFDKTVIPWSERVNKLSGHVAGILGNMDKISKLLGGDDSDPKPETKSNKKKEKEKEKDKDKDKNKNKNEDKADDSVSGDLLGKPRPGAKSETRKNQKTTFWDVDYEDNSHREYPAIDVGKLFGDSPAPSKQTMSLVSSSSSSSVSSLPAASTRSQNFISGLLAAPTDKE